MNTSIENILILLVSILSVIAILTILIYHSVKKYRSIETRFSPEAIADFKVFLQPCKDYCKMIDTGGEPISICSLYIPRKQGNKYTEIDEISEHLKPTKTYLKRFYHEDSGLFWWPMYRIGGRNGRLAYCRWVIKTFGE